MILINHQNLPIQLKYTYWLELTFVFNPFLRIEAVILYT
jgi:hypothetical protein